MFKLWPKEVFMRFMTPYLGLGKFSIVLSLQKDSLTCFLHILGWMDVGWLHQEVWTRIKHGYVKKGLHDFIPFQGMVVFQEVCSKWYFSR
jgi:hypothetical protein